jgi:hypothetical protein
VNTPLPAIDWSKQHCGVILASFDEVVRLMPEVGAFIAATFPDNPADFTWDVKVHMLLPRMYPCIPNWHADAVPRVNGIQRFDLVRPELPLYLWVSGAPLTQFEGGYLDPGTWHRYTQLDRHRGTPASAACWRALIRAVHQALQPPGEGDRLRRHSQVYLDAEHYTC